jgi:hypothetical protein
MLPIQQSKLTGFTANFSPYVRGGV